MEKETWSVSLGLVGARQFQFFLLEQQVSDKNKAFRQSSPQRVMPAFSDSWQAVAPAFRDDKQLRARL
jgi:hypothetical protein